MLVMFVDLLNFVSIIFFAWAVTSRNGYVSHRAMALTGEVDSHEASLLQAEGMHQRMRSDTEILGLGESFMFHAGRFGMILAEIPA